MLKKSSNPYYHISYWVFVIFILTMFFGRSWGNGIASLFFVSMLLPITLGTSYFFNYVLVPKFYLKRRFIRFGLYTFYMLVVSLYLESIVIMFSFIYLGSFNYQNLPPNASDTLLLAVVMYLLVFLGSFLLMTRQIKEREKLIQQLQEEQEKQNISSLELTSNRKMVKVAYDEIIYIESLADYIKVHTKEGEVTSKEKISNIAERLPSQFIRIHRSFIINKAKIKEVSYNELMVDNVTLNIGRTYQKAVKDALKI